MKLFSHNSNLYDHDTSTSQTDGRTDGLTDGQLVLAVQRSARLRAVKTDNESPKIREISHFGTKTN